jgi:hypothetical protein
VDEVRREPADLPYADRFTVLLWAVSLLGLLEVGVVHLLTARWPVVRWPLLVLGVVGLVGFLVFGRGLRRSPHRLDGETLVLRSGPRRSVRLPLDTLVAVRKHVVAGHRRVIGLEGDELVVSVMGDTDVELRFDPPAQTVVRGALARVARAHFYADDPAAAVRLLRQRMDA